MALQKSSSCNGSFDFTSSSSRLTKHVRHCPSDAAVSRRVYELFTSSRLGIIIGLILAHEAEPHKPQYASVCIAPRRHWPQGITEDLSHVTRAARGRVRHSYNFRSGGTSTVLRREARCVDHPLRAQGTPNVTCSDAHTSTRITKTRVAQDQLDSMDVKESSGWSGWLVGWLWNGLRTLHSSPPPHHKQIYRSRADTCYKCCIRQPATRASLSS